MALSDPRGQRYSRPSQVNPINASPGPFTKYPWLAISPGLAIFLTIISVNYIGDGMRDAFDPDKVLKCVGEYP